MKRMFFPVVAALCFSFWGMPVMAAPSSAQITFTVPEPPDEMQGRSLTATVSAGPSDPLAVQVVLSNLNGYTETVVVEPGTYYCNAAVQYDLAGDYPVTEIDDVYEVTLAEGDSVTLTYTVGTVGYYESITGERRFADEIEMFTPPADYNPDAVAQIGTYLTAPDGFDHHVIVYLGNQYTGDAYTLDVYAANDLAALRTDASAGRYQFLGARVADDESGRYSIQCDQATMNTADGAVFHLTLIDTDHPDRELTTPSQDTNGTVQQARTHNASKSIDELTPQPTPKSETPPAVEPIPEKNNLLPQIITFVILALAGVGVYFLRKKFEEVW